VSASSWYQAGPPRLVLRVQVDADGRRIEGRTHGEDVAFDNAEPLQVSRGDGPRLVRDPPLEEGRHLGGHEAGAFGHPDQRVGPMEQLRYGSEVH
jgi:hypothetical protein